MKQSPKKILVINTGRLWDGKAFSMLKRILFRKYGQFELKQIHCRMQVNWLIANEDEFVRRKLWAVDNYINEGYEVHLIPHATSAMTAHVVSFLTGKLGKAPKMILVRRFQDEPDSEAYYGPARIMDLERTRQKGIGRKENGNAPTKNGGV